MGHGCNYKLNPNLGALYFQTLAFNSSASYFSRFSSYFFTSLFSYFSPAKWLFKTKRGTSAEKWHINEYNSMVKPLFSSSPGEPKGGV